MKINSRLLDKRETNQTEEGEIRRLRGKNAIVRGLTGSEKKKGKI